MPKVKISADVISYNAAISACEKGGQWQQALTLFEAMPKAMISPNVVSFSAAISACQKGGQWQQALTLFEAIPKTSIPPTVICYNAAISACQKGGQWQLALTLFDAMPVARLQADIVTYSAVLDSSEISESELGGGIFQHGLLPVLETSTLRSTLKLDLHNHSEGAARLTLRWWLSSTVARAFKTSERLNCIVVTGHGKSRQAWGTSDVRAAALDLLRSFALDARILPERLDLYGDTFPLSFL
eukprot:Skav220387  [mRNA]  locus=scaffold639:162903:163631:- [translate_table: standard]